MSLLAKGLQCLLGLEHCLLKEQDPRAPRLDVERRVRITPDKLVTFRPRVL